MFMRFPLAPKGPTVAALGALFLVALGTPSRAAAAASADHRKEAEKHTGNGQAYYDEATKAAEAVDRVKTLKWLLAARQEYDLASTSWTTYLDDDRSASDAYRSGFLFADALRWRVRIQLDLHRLAPDSHGEPSATDVDFARTTARAVRDTKDHDEYLDDLATYVVDLTDVARDLAFDRFAESEGRKGFARRAYPDFPKHVPYGGDRERVLGELIPDELLASMLAREDYVARVPPEKDKSVLPRRIAFRDYVAERYFLYGHYKEARERYETIYRERCQKDALAYTAWSYLFIMSVDEGDVARSHQLLGEAKARSCAVVDGKVDDKLKEHEDGLMRTPLEPPPDDSSRLWLMAVLAVAAIGRMGYRVVKK